VDWVPFMTALHNLASVCLSNSRSSELSGFGFQISGNSPCVLVFTPDSRHVAAATAVTKMQLPLIISYKEFEERLRTGPQQFRAWELRQLRDGVLLDGRDFECQIISGGWVFGHVPATGESDWIDSKKIYELLKVRGRVADPRSSVALPAGVPRGRTSANTTRGPRAKIRRGPGRTARKGPSAGKRKAGRSVRVSKRSARKSTAPPNKKTGIAARRAREADWSPRPVLSQRRS
jgi:hypothetical protein